MFNLKIKEGWFRLIADLEGVSFLVLLLIAMPLKYIWDKPWMVQNVGMAHGVLFVAYVFMVIFCREDFRWNIKQSALALIASFIPFGTFWVNAKLVPSQKRRQIQNDIATKSPAVAGLLLSLAACA